ncbi:type II toxin-antitoxin system RatA family toxin [Streptomyces sp. Ag109_G2-15]|uniref:type II toxin-antitoxin system RatA family toxin n=1 Tax=Streptomyces sp. Ag109_G2-15 TaxID=1938850 RepID=UPI000BCF40E8|nr:SRPBCC family protein [Streptomyces sp. Ag109_G2-15]SOE07561.1 Ribosome association toxin PasT (RatA) of the RatAB toxin-antitoxin module [Streptomyces sp. Ag109_G2-15]
MRHVAIEALLPGSDPLTVFERLKDFERYPAHTDAVREVTVRTEPDGTLLSEWSVNFRNGELRWSERDTVDTANLALRFEQVDGDFERFDGAWTVLGTGDDTTVRFAADFDLGMPSLERIIDPIAERTLRENISAILVGLLGDTLVFATAMDADDLQTTGG